MWLSIFSPFHLFNSSPFYGFGVFGFLFKSFRFGLSTSTSILPSALRIASFHVTMMRGRFSAEATVTSSSFSSIREGIGSAKRKDVAQVERTAHRHHLYHDIAQRDKHVPHIALAQRRFAHDAVDEPLLRELHRSLLHRSIPLLPLARAYSENTLNYFKTNHVFLCIK